MLALIANTEYLVEGIKLTFKETVEYGEVAVFESEGRKIELATEELFELDIEKIN